MVRLEPGPALVSALAPFAGLAGQLGPLADDAADYPAELAQLAFPSRPRAGWGEDPPWWVSEEQLAADAAAAAAAAAAVAAAVTDGASSAPPAFDAEGSRTQGDAESATSLETITVRLARLGGKFGLRLNDDNIVVELVRDGSAEVNGKIYEKDQVRAARLARLAAGCAAGCAAGGWVRGCTSRRVVQLDWSVPSQVVAVDGKRTSKKETVQELLGALPSGQRAVTLTLLRSAVI